MIIINNVYGQLGNQLFLFAHLLAHGMATGQRVWFPGFRKNQVFFEYFAEDRKSWSKYVYLPFSADRSQEVAERSLRRLFHNDSRILHFLDAVTLRKLHVSLDPLKEFMFPENEGGEQLPSPVCLFEGWVFRVPSAFKTFAPQLRNIFRFREVDIRHSKTFLKVLPQQLIIGVHIRRGDFASTASQFHYSPVQYLKWMTELRHEMGQQVGFVVVSDESLPDFNESWIVCHRGSAIQDLCVLSHCNRIMGPPSTYNRWAAFMGEKSHLCLWNDKQQVKGDDFAFFKMTRDLKTLSAQDIDTLKWYGIV